MSYQPPPPPPGGANQPAKFDPKAINPLDWGIIGAGVLAFIFSLLPYYTIDVDYGGLAGDASGSVNAWNGFFGWFAALLAVVGAAAVAATLFAPQIDLPFPARLIGLGTFALATLFVILALFVIPDGDVDDIPGVDTGHGIGYWLSLIVIVAGLGMSLMRFQATGGQLPGGMQGRVPNVGGYGPQGGISGGTANPSPGNPSPGHPSPGQNPPPPPAGGTPPPPPPSGYGPPQ